MCRERKKEWVLKICDETQDLENTISSRVYDKIKKFGSKKGVSGNNIIKDKNGKILVKVDKIKNKWEEYINMLYNTDNREEHLKFDDALSGLPIIQDETRSTIKAMKQEMQREKLEF